MPFAPEPVHLPKHVIQRARRVLEYHAASKHARGQEDTRPVDWQDPPSPYRIFYEHPQVDLPKTLLELPADAMDVMRYGPDSLPEGLMHPPHDLVTLATWLYMAGGITTKAEYDGQAYYLRTCPSAGALYPFEIYVAAFAIDGLEPGLYHFSPWKFHLRKLRGGPETLARLTRGRPELRFLKTAPGALLISTNYWRSAWKYGLRGYRYALLDAGHLVQNVLTVAAGLGIPAMARLRVSESAMRELIGVPADAPFDQAESVQAIVAWAERSQRPMAEESSANDEPVAAILRAPLSRGFVDHPEILATQHDCVAPGVAVAEMRPPLTDLNVIPAELPKIPVAAGAPEEGLRLDQVMMSRRSARQFARRAIPHRQFAELNWLAFRGGTSWPMRPDGQHVATVRPFWFVHAVEGLEPGLWYYDPVKDAWAVVREGDFREPARKLFLEQNVAADAAALCVMVSNLRKIMGKAGPDAYRLAHLEAGMVGQRLYLAATAMQLGVNGLGAFCDDELRRFLGLGESNWEAIYATAIGTTA